MHKGELWEKFYRDFKHFLPEEFVMNKRVKRPPDNPINALVFHLVIAYYILRPYPQYIEHI